MNKRSFSTRALHLGEHMPPADYTSVANPIFPSVGYMYNSIDDMDAVFANTKAGYVYPRYGGPNLTAFETAVAGLEEGEAAIAFASGMAAIHAALLVAGVRAGTHIVAAMDVYGATYTLLDRLFKQLGATVSFVDVVDLAAVEVALAETKAVALVAETISNPLLKVANVPALARLARRHQAQLLVDNTFATPYLCRPFPHGAHFVMHSATKFIAGHGDVLAGIVVTSTENRHELFELNKIVGGVLGPFEAWLAMRGLKTLPLRLRQQCAGALDVAQWLSKHPKVTRVNYPGLAGHPQHNLAGKLFEGQGFGGVLSFEIAGASQAGAFRFMETLELCLPATTLGDIYTLVMHPATTSHRGLSPEARGQIGIGDNLLRLSIGIEDVEDIIADLAQALDQM